MGGFIAIGKLFNRGFWVSYLISVLLNYRYAVPAVILLVLHFVFDISLIWFAIAVAAWLIIVLVRLVLVSVVGICVDRIAFPQEHIFKTRFKEDNENNECDNNTGEDS